MRIGTKVKLTRIILGQKQYELASELSISQSQLSLIENNRMDVREELKAKLKEVLMKRAQERNTQFPESLLELEEAD